MAKIALAPPHVQTGEDEKSDIKLIFFFERFFSEFFSVLMPMFPKSNPQNLFF